jgi:hypothetical protein
MAKRDGKNLSPSVTFGSTLRRVRHFGKLSAGRAGKDGSLFMVHCSWQEADRGHVAKKAAKTPPFRLTVTV